ncbi:hypothetical protein BDR05DRAFT_881051, partial [Suillus weaverae]
KLMAHILINNKLALAWDKSKKGHFWDNFFPLVIIPTIEHIPWVHQQPPIPPRIKDEVVKLFKPKIASSIYKASNTSYQSCWFYIAKKSKAI